MSDRSGARAQETMKPKRRKRLSAEERREQLLAAAQRVFVRSGLGGSRTREIAGEAGVNEATLFAHFKSKEDLFDAAIVEPMERMIQSEIEVAKNYEHASSAKEQRHLNLEAHRRLLTTIREVYPLLITALFSDSERGRHFYNDHLYPWFRALAPTIRESFDGRKRAVADAEALSMVGVGAYFMLVLDHYYRDREMDPDRLVSIVARLFESGVYDK